MSLKKIISSAADQFKPQGTIKTIRAYGRGNIHATYLVVLNHSATDKFILQRINTDVFPNPEKVMQNIGTCCKQVLNRLRDYPPAPGRRWEVPRVLLTQNGQDHWIGPDGAFWRALSFIDRARSFDTIQDLTHAREVGYALGMFHRLTRDLPVENLVDTLEGFHIAPGYLRHLDAVLTQKKPSRSPEVDHGLGFVNRRRSGIDILERAKEQGLLELRVIHGDPKVNNVMIDISTRQAVSLVDLDTVKPGLIHYDIGDCLRSGCNPLGEETEHWEKVRFEPDLCRAILSGYLAEAGNFLKENDYRYLFEAIRLIAFELGLRFFTDYLEGNIYFKAVKEKQNLTRALVQFKLTESIESQEPAIRALIRDLK
jgi:Ser/Thr protein kinase RdoA (MazF antagonist)